MKTEMGRFVMIKTSYFSSIRILYNLIAKNILAIKLKSP
jgi:hypothetical protein